MVAALQVKIRNGLQGKKYCQPKKKVLGVVTELAGFQRTLALELGFGVFH